MRFLSRIEITFFLTTVKFHRAWLVSLDLYLERCEALTIGYLPE